MFWRTEHGKPRKRKKRSLHLRHFARILFGHNADLPDVMKEIYHKTGASAREIADVFLFFGKKV